MTDPADRFLARRILVPVDASSASLDAAAAGAALAARLGSELVGLFVEDEDVLRLAALPFAAVVRIPGGGRERLDPASAAAALRAAAAHAREAVGRSATSHHVAWSFRVTRGRVAREVLAAAAEADLVVLAAAGHGRGGAAVGGTARATAAGATAPVLLLARAGPLEGAVVAVDDGTPAGARAVAVARALAPADRAPAIVCPQPRTTDEAIVAALARLGATLVALPRTDEASRGVLVERLLGAGVAVLVVR